MAIPFLSDISGKSATFTGDLTVSASNPFVTIEGSSSSYVNGGIQFITNHASSARGLGTFYYNAHTDVEWFAGLPYDGNDAFVINRNSSYTVPSSESSPPGVGASAGTKFIIDSSGKVGINISNPNEKLHVEGTTRLNGDIHIGSSASGIIYRPVESGSAIDRYFLMFDSTNNASYPFLTNRTPNGAVVIKTGTAAAGGENEHFRIKGGDGVVDAYFTNAKVGVGTDDPEFALHLAYNAGSGGLNSGVMLEMRSSTATDPAGMRFVSQTGGSTNYMQNLYDGANLKWKHWSGSAYVDKITFSNAGDGTFDGSLNVGKSLHVGPSQSRYIFNSDTVTVAGSGTSNAGAIEWKEGTHYIPSLAYAFKVRLVTTGTGTDTGANYIVYYNNTDSAWVVRHVSLAGNTSNHPLLTMVSDGTGTYMGAYDNHSGTYHIRYFVESWDTGDQDMDGHAFGSDFHWQRLNDTLTYSDGNVVVNDNLNFNTNGYANFGNIGTGAMRFKPSGETLALTLTGANAEFAGDVTVSKTDPTITLVDTASANTDPNGTIIFSEVSGTQNFDINYNGASDRLEFRGRVGNNDNTDLAYINRDLTTTLQVLGGATFEGNIIAQNTGGAGLNLRRDDTTISGTNALGYIGFAGDDPTDGTFNYGSLIRGRANGSWGTSSYPGELEFQTRNTSGSLTTALTLNKDQSATFAGEIHLVDTNTKILEGALNAVRIQTNSGYVDVGPKNTGHCHIETDRSNFYFNKYIQVNGGIVSSYDEDLSLRRAVSDAGSVNLNVGSFYSKSVGDSQVQLGGFTINTALEDTYHCYIPGISPNAFAGAHRRLTVTATKNGTSITATDLANSFLAHEETYSVSTANTDTIIIEISGFHLTYGQWYGITFGAAQWRAKDIDIEISTDNGSNYTSIYSENNQPHATVRTYHGGGSTGVNKIKYTLTNWNTTSTRINHIFGYKYLQADTNYLDKYMNSSIYASINFKDNYPATFGNSGDLVIKHTGSNSIIETHATDSTGDLYIKSQGTNHDLYLQAADDILIQPQGSENGIRVHGNDNVELYFNNVRKLRTTNTGINVEGEVVATTLDISGNIQFSDGYLFANSVTSSSTTTTVASVSSSTYTAVFFDYSIKNGTNVRAGTVVATHDGTNVEFNETSTVDLGDTSDVTLSVDLVSSNLNLKATTTSSTWTVKSLVRAI